VRIVQVANFYGPASGGLRTTVDALGRGYRAAGHDRTLIVPGPAARDEDTAAGRRITVAAPILPGSGGYRAVLDWRQVAAIVPRLDPDCLEVSDRFTLWPLGAWAGRHDLPAVLFAHERLDAILRVRVPQCVPLAPVADRWNRRLAAVFPTVVCTSAFGRAEWDRIGSRNVETVPLGVELSTFTPGPASGAHLPDIGPVRRGTAQLVCLGRLSKEKRPDLAVGALAELVAAGVPAELTMIGDGPKLGELRQASRGLPVRFLGHVDDRRAVAHLLAAADMVIAPCPVESFGLSVLEALACGTPVVTANAGAAQELLAPRCGVAAAPRASALAAAVAVVLTWPKEQVGAATRAQAARFPWSATIGGMLGAHRAPMTAALAS